MKLTEVIRRPLITEKTTVLREDGRTLVFHVVRDANKLDVKRAVETLLGAKVENVRHGHGPRQGEAAGEVFGPTAGLEEGLRAPPRRGEAAGVPAGRVSVPRIDIHAHSQVQTDIAWDAVSDRPDVRRDHDRYAVSSADRDPHPDRRTEQPWGADLVVARRPAQASVPRSSTSSGTRRTFRPPSRRSSTTRTGRPGLRS